MKQCRPIQTARYAGMVGNLVVLFLIICCLSGLLTLSWLNSRKRLQTSSASSSIRSIGWLALVTFDSMGRMWRIRFSKSATFGHVLPEQRLMTAAFVN
ncbi:MAG: hypothetical protein GY758_22950 [Fuerstiella sp.]|nr:hypothetical protein [Fuerstiella sp.]MCP4506074.1 hypothetical protein [Fuerstiella sp.]